MTVYEDSKIVKKAFLLTRPESAAQKKTRSISEACNSIKRPRSAVLLSKDKTENKKKSNNFVTNNHLNIVLPTSVKSEAQEDDIHQCFEANNDGDEHHVLKDVSNGNENFDAGNPFSKAINSCRQKSCSFSLDENDASNDNIITLVQACDVPNMLDPHSDDESCESGCTTPRFEIPEPKSNSPLFSLPRYECHNGIVVRSGSEEPSHDKAEEEEEETRRPRGEDSAEASVRTDSSDDPADASTKLRDAMSSCTLSAFTPDSLVEQEVVKGYSDILDVLERLEQDKGNNATTTASSASRASTSMTTKNADKISELFNYLDMVDNEDPQKAPTPFPKSPLKGKPGSISNSVSELAKESPQKLAEKLVRVRFTVEENERAIAVLRQALEHQRKINGSMTLKFQKELDQRLKQQKDEYDATITRHQSFIDQLIEDKRSLSERCDLLHLDLKNSERKHQESVRNLEQRHSAELRRIKSLQETSNKLKQEKWLDEKTKRIKEQTVRGLEPELQRLMSRHSSELSVLEAEKERLLLGQERELHVRHVQHVRELRALWEEEQHEAVQKERQIVTQRLQAQVQELLSQHEQEVERVQELLRRERARAADDRNHLEKEAEQVRRIAQERAEAEIERVREEEEAKRRTMAKKHAAELGLFKENEASERAEWEMDCRQKLQEEWQEREKALAAKFKHERDSELDKVVQKLEAEVAAQKKQVEKEMEEQISRLRTKIEFESNESEKEAKMLREKFNNVRQERASLEEETIVYKASIKQKDILIEELQKINERLESEREDIRSAVRGEFSSALEVLSQERGGLLSDLADMRLKLAEMKSEKEAVERERRREAEMEVEKIHERVKAAISKKDETIQDLRRNYEQALEQIEHLEATIERQTKDKVLHRK